MKISENFTILQKRLKSTWGCLKLNDCWISVRWKGNKRREMMMDDSILKYTSWTSYLDFRTLAAEQCYWYLSSTALSYDVSWQKSYSEIIRKAKEPLVSIAFSSGDLGQITQQLTVAVTKQVCLKEVCYTSKRKFRRNLSEVRQDKMRS